jgi:SAM-dependent methyltransferase
MRVNPIATRECAAYHRTMPNPWLRVSLEDYEGHMNSAGVQQLGALSDLLRQALVAAWPGSVAILGIAGGNGLEHVDARIIKRVVGLDVNPSFLASVRKRYSSVMGLELQCSDLAEQRLNLEPVELVHAALVF